MNPIKVFPVLICSFLLSNVELGAQQQFEGVILYQIKSLPAAGQDNVLPEFTEYRIKGNDMIIQLIGSENEKMARILIKGQEKAFYLIDDPQKTAMKVRVPDDEKEIGNVPEQFREEYDKALKEAGDAYQSDRFMLEATGESMSIAGYQCEKYIVRIDNGPAFVAEVWLTSEIKVEVPEVLKDENNPLLVFMNEKGFPLKLIGRTDAKATLNTFEMMATEINQLVMDPAEFSIPDDYYISDLTGLLEGN